MGRGFHKKNFLFRAPFGEVVRVKGRTKGNGFGLGLNFMAKKRSLT